MAQINLNSLGRIPHACLICAPDMAAAMAEARRVAAAALCEGSDKKPCGVCRHCRKAEAGIHPDIILIGRLFDDKGKIHMEKADLLAYVHGEYFTLGRKVGAFGFSAVKRKKHDAPRRPTPKKQ